MSANSGVLLLNFLIFVLCYTVYAFIMKKRDVKINLRIYFRYAVFHLCVTSILNLGVLKLLQWVSTDSADVLFAEPYVFFVLSAVCCLITAARYEMVYNTGSREKDGIPCTVLACCCGTVAVLLCEIFVFNYLSFVPKLKDLKPATLSISNADVSNGAQMTRDGIRIGREGATVVFHNINAKTCCLRLYGQSHNLENISVSISDDNMAVPFYDVGSYDLAIDAPSSTVLPVYSSGNMKDLKITFNTSDEFLLQKVIVNEPDLFLSRSRFFGLLALVLAAIFFKKKRLWRVTYSPGSFGHSVAIIAVIIVLCLLSFKLYIVCGDNNKNIQYPLTSPEGYSCYVQQFDAFQKGQLNLDLKVDSSLSKLDNPYDFSLRQSKNVKFDWDRSYYKGKYYSYFGITPLLVVYYPYYFITKQLPSDMTVACILAIPAILMLVLLVREAALLFCKRINLVLLLLGMITTVFVSLLFMLQVSADFYYIPYLSALLFLSVFLFLLLRAYKEPRFYLKLFLLFLSGMAYILLVGSRPTVALYIIAVLPLLLKMLLTKNTSLAKKTMWILAFAVPVVIGAGLLMWYNNARFGSPFEFGQDYQLTIDNMRWNKTGILNILPTVYYFFLQFPNLLPKFPYFYAVSNSLNYFSSYKLKEAMMGVLGFPIVWALFTARQANFWKTDRFKKSTFLLAVLCSMIIAFVDYSSSGILCRYSADISVTLVICAVLVILDNRYIGGNLDISVSASFLSLKKFFYGYVCVAMYVSIFIGAALIFYNERNFLQTCAPAFYAHIERISMFW